MNYRTHIVSSLSEIGQPAWDGLAMAQERSNPFLSYAFLHALHESGSACAKNNNVGIRHRLANIVEAPARYLRAGA